MKYFDDQDTWHDAAKKLGYEIEYGYDGASAWLPGIMMGEWIPNTWTANNQSIGWLKNSA